MKFNRKDYSNELLLEMYEELLKPRMIEEKMLLLLRQGKVSKWFSGIGQEAISVGAALALDTDEYLLPMHRNLGVFTARKVPLNRLFAQFQGKMSGFTKGRDRSFHFGSNAHHIVGMISHLGSQMGVADGIALGDVLGGKKKVTLVFSGDGGSSEGDFHESINVAAVWGLPVVFLVENNGYGLSTPSNEQFRFKHFVDKGIGYGIEAVQVDGNNILEVYRTISELARSMREKPRPVLLECITFRMRGHEEASGVKYVPKALFEQWEKKDPVVNFEQYLLKEKVLTEQQIEISKVNIKKEIDDALVMAYTEEHIVPDTALEYKDLFAPVKPLDVNPTSGKTTEKRLVDAISDGLRQCMEKHDELVLMGQDIAEYGGVFKVTEGFVEQFGKGRVRNTPLCEAAIVGTALGLSVKGYKAMVEMQFADFVTEGFNQIVNNLAKLHWRWGQQADVVVRMPTGGGVAAGPFHSQSIEAWFCHVPGLKVVYPAFPYDAKGLLATAIAEPNPVLFFEHKGLYRSITQQVPDDYYTLPLGKASLIEQGEDVTIVTYGLGVHWAMDYLAENRYLKADLIDLRTLVPMDTETVFNSVKKTSRVIVLHEATLTAGIGAEIAALITEHCFEYLDAPVVRAASLDTPVPFINALETNFLAKSQFHATLSKLMAY
jgi:2-oxoisovalerate dehydrogenase E1 component